MEPPGAIDAVASIFLISPSDIAEYMTLSDERHYIQIEHGALLSYVWAKLHHDGAADCSGMSMLPSKLKQPLLHLTNHFNDMANMVSTSVVVHFSTHVCHVMYVT